MTNLIRAALDKARAVYCYADGECPCATPDDCSMKLRSDVPAKIIAAFLRALPEDADLVLPSLGPIFPVATLADAVLAAAKEDRE